VAGRPVAMAYLRVLPVLGSLGAEHGLNWCEMTSPVARCSGISRPGCRVGSFRAQPGMPSQSRRGPKAGRRALPLPAPVTAALCSFKATQAAERLAAGAAHQGTGYVLVDELGQPFKTDQLRRAAYKLMRRAGGRKVRLYDAWHACLTHLLVSGVPDVIVSAWAGHADLSMAKKVYAHPSAKDLEQGRDVLAALLGS
jgi:integrase